MTSVHHGAWMGGAAMGRPVMFGQPLKLILVHELISM